jgi:hypothetical protein
MVTSFQVQSSEVQRFKVQGSGFKVQGSRFRVQRFRVQGLVFAGKLEGY